MPDPHQDRSIPIARLPFRQANKPVSSSAKVPDRSAAHKLDRPQRLHAIQERARAHCARHKPLWVGRETVRLMNQRIKAQLSHPAPRGVAKQMSAPQSIARQARQNVEARITKRLSRLNTMRPAFGQKADQTARIRQAPKRNYGIKQ